MSAGVLLPAAGRMIEPYILVWLGALFVVNFIGGQLPLVIGMIIITSVAVPFVLPSIVYAYVRSQFEIPLLQMMFLLSIALFTPLAAGWLTKKYFPSGSKFADKNSFPLSLLFIVLINWGMFAKFAGLFYSEQTFLLQTITTAFLCYATYCLVGYVGMIGNSSLQEKRAGLIATSYVNNVLVAVFAFQFFGSHVAALAALYNIPYYIGIIVIKKIDIASRRSR